MISALLGREIRLGEPEKTGWPPLPEGLFWVGGVVVLLYDIGVLVVSLVLIIALQLFLSRTMPGRAMQATAQNPETARVLGVDVERMILYTFVITAVLALSPPFW